MELMRHFTPEMTLGTYAQTVGDEKRTAGERVALLLLAGGDAAYLTYAAEAPMS